MMRRAKRYRQPLVLNGEFTSDTWLGQVVTVHALHIQPIIGTFISGICTHGLQQSYPLQSSGILFNN